MGTHLNEVVWLFLSAPRGKAPLLRYTLHRSLPLNYRMFSVYPDCYPTRVQALGPRSLRNVVKEVGKQHRMCKWDRGEVTSHTEHLSAFCVCWDRLASRPAALPSIAPALVAESHTPARIGYVAPAPIRLAYVPCSMDDYCRV